MLDWLKRKAAESAATAVERVEPAIGNVADGETVVSSDRVKMLQLFDYMNTPAGASVTEASAMRVSAVYACSRLIAGAIASLPVHIYERLANSRERTDHNYWWLLNEQPNPAWSAAVWWEFCVNQTLFRGDSINYLVRNRAGMVTAILPFPRSDVVVQKRKKADPKEPDRLIYGFRTEDGTFGADQDDVLHFPGFGFNGVSSMSVIQWGARNSIGTAIKADEYAGKFFAGGGQPHIAIKAPGEFNAEMQEMFISAWQRKYGASGPNGLPLILTEGLDVKELSMSAEDAQLLESRKWQVVDIARAFGVPPFMIGETEKSTSWGSGIESMGIGFVIYTLGPHLNRIKQELNRKLFRTSRYFSEHSTTALLRGDSKGRADYYKAALGGTQAPGWMTQNEVRGLENLPPREDGDELAKPVEKDNAPAQEPNAEPAGSGDGGGGESGSAA